MRTFVQDARPSAPPSRAVPPWLLGVSAAFAYAAMMGAVAIARRVLE